MTPPPQRQYKCWGRCGLRWFDTLPAAAKSCIFCGSAAITHKLAEK